MIAETGYGGAAAAGGPGSLTMPPLAAGLVETSSSVLVFLADRVLKIRKQLDFGSVDFRDRAARLAACQSEVSDNRSLAPDVYLGVADLVGPDGNPCDHMVVMRRLPAPRRLSALVEGRAEVTTELDGLARMLAGFHADAASSPRIAEEGDPARLRERWHARLGQIRRDGGTVVGAGVLDQIACLSDRYLDGREDLLRRRQAAGLIRDGHGDLVAADIFCLDDGPRILDRLEPAAGPRAADVLADVGALAVDLEWLGRRDLARYLLDRYRESAGSDHPRSLEEFYRALGSLARCEAACRRYAAGDVAAAGEARAFAEMALARLRRGRVRLVLVGGQAGAGKSGLATALADAEHWTSLGFDGVEAGRGEVRTRVERDEGAPAAGTDAATVIDAVHDELLRRAARALRRGDSVVVEAPWNRHPQRRRAAGLAVDLSADLVQLRCAATAEPGADRADRAGRRPAGPTRPTGPTRLADSITRIEPWPEARIVDTAAPAADVLRSARRAVS